MNDKITQDLIDALRDMLMPDKPDVIRAKPAYDVQFPEMACRHCGRGYYQERNERLPVGNNLCTSDDCPGYKARAVLKTAEDAMRLVRECFGTQGENHE